MNTRFARHKIILNFRQICTRVPSVRHAQ